MALRISAVMVPGGRSGWLDDQVPETPPACAPYIGDIVRRIDARNRNMVDTPSALAFWPDS
jgi:hypothetical protein